MEETDCQPQDLIIASPKLGIFVAGLWQRFVAALCGSALWQLCGSFVQQSPDSQIEKSQVILKLKNLANVRGAYELGLETLLIDVAASRIRTEWRGALCQCSSCSNEDCQT